MPQPASDASRTLSGILVRTVAAARRPALLAAILVGVCAVGIIVVNNNREVSTIYENLRAARNGGIIIPPGRGSLEEVLRIYESQASHAAAALAAQRRGTIAFSLAASFSMVSALTLGALTSAWDHKPGIAVVTWAATRTYVHRIIHRLGFAVFASLLMGSGIYAYSHAISYVTAPSPPQSISPDPHSVQMLAGLDPSFGPAILFLFGWIIVFALIGISLGVLTRSAPIALTGVAAILVADALTAHQIGAYHDFSAVFGAGRGVLDYGSDILAPVVTRLWWNLPEGITTPARSISSLSAWAASVTIIAILAARNEEVGSTAIK